MEVSRRDRFSSENGQVGHQGEIPDRATWWLQVVLVRFEQNTFLNGCFGRNSTNLVNSQNGRKHIHIKRLERLNVACRER